MPLNQSFLDFIKPYLTKIRDKVGDDFVVFGSAPLYLLGVVEFKDKINDLDISLRNPASVPADAAAVTFHKDQNQKFYKMIIDGLEVDMASLWPGQEYFFNKIHDTAFSVDGFKFASLDVVEEWKQEMIRKYDRQKDKDYLRQIQEFRQNKYDK